jgi:hypothetical protein
VVIGVREASTKNIKSGLWVVSKVLPKSGLNPVTVVLGNQIKFRYWLVDLFWFNLFAVDSKRVGLKSNF